MRTFLLKMIALGLCVAGVQTLAGRYLPLQISEFVFESRLRETKLSRPSVLFFGDSVITYFPKEEKNPVSIVDRFHELSPEYCVLKMNYPAMHPLIQKEVLEWTVRKGIEHDLMILPVNLRAFSIPWRLSPAFQFPTERAIFRLDGYIPKPLVRSLFVWKVLPVTPVSTKEYMAAYRDWMLNFAPKIGESEGIPRQFVENYQYLLTENSPLLNDLKSMLALERTNGRKCLVYLTPVDVESAKQECGPALVEAIDRNVEVIRKVCQEFGARCLDLHSALEPGDFMWKEERLVSEHLNAKGRDTVATRVAQEAKDLLGPFKTENK